MRREKQVEKSGAVRSERTSRTACDGSAGVMEEGGTDGSGALS